MTRGAVVRPANCGLESMSRTMRSVIPMMSWLSIPTPETGPRWEGSSSWTFIPLS